MSTIGVTIVLNHLSTRPRHYPGNLPHSVICADNKSFHCQVLQHQVNKPADMKFPLPADTFPTLLLSPEDKRTIEAVAEGLVKSTFARYYEHATVHQSIVDERHWKKFKQRENLCVYRTRNATRIPRPATLGSETTTSKSSSASSSRDSMSKDNTGLMAPLLVVGSIPGNLDDILYGMLSPSVEEMQLKSAYMEDGLVDWGFVSSIITPSEQQPLRELSLKWFIKGYPLLVDAVMRTRDTFFIDSVGTMTTPDGERIGYHLFHSVEIPEIPELTELNIVRGKISICELYRQRRDNSVEVFVYGLYIPMGDIPASVTAIVATEVAVSIVRHIHCAEMKKLTRILCSGQRQHEQEPWLRGVTSASKSDSNGSSRSTSDLRVSLYPAHSASSSSKTCGLCNHSVGGGLSFVRSKEKHCRICLERICSRCRIHKTIFLPSGTAKQLSSAKMAFCTRCIMQASAASSARFAKLDALVSEGKTVEYTELLR